MLFHAMNNTFSNGLVGQMFSEQLVNQAWLRLALVGCRGDRPVIVYGSKTCRASIQSR